jgi:hypothetical protein
MTTAELSFRSRGRAAPLQEPQRTVGSVTLHTVRSQRPPLSHRLHDDPLFQRRQLLSRKSDKLAPKLSQG